MSNWDKEYLKLCKTILEEGKEVINRTGINTIKIPNYNFSFDLEKEFPFLTTKKLYYKAAIKELLWIYKGINDVRWLQDRGVHIWDEWEIDEDGIYRVYYPTGKEPENAPESLPVYFNTGKIGSDGKDILEKMYYDEEGIYKESEKTINSKPMMASPTKKVTEEGKVLRFARYFGKEYAHTIGHAYGYTVNKNDYLNKTISLINASKVDPSISDSRRILINLWQEEDIKDAVLKPCVFMSMWDVTDGYLNGTVVQRSCDVPLGLPFNVTQYSTLAYLLAHITGLKPGVLNYTIKDAHIYVNQIDGIKEQIQRGEEIKQGLREEYPAPILEIDKNINSFEDIDDKNLTNIRVRNYKHHGEITFPLAQ